MAETCTKSAHLFVSVRTIKYLVRSGRVSMVRGLLARILNVNPVVSIDGSGKAILLDKTFSQKANMAIVMKHITKINQTEKIWNYIVLHANNTDAAEWYSTRMEMLTSKKPAFVVNISPVLGAHAGTGAAAVALLCD